ncbi:MAG: hypothetical protein VB099_13280 [Candidatus Limiplasma sp.]|nr:hypothetical protein [Candidatus Limiplasma sp.]
MNFRGEITGPESWMFLGFRGDAPEEGIIAEGGDKGMLMADFRKEKEHKEGREKKA